MQRIGLTGSIAVGKTFVCDCFKKRGAFVLDADKTARDVVAKGSVGLEKIVENFGNEVLTAGGELDRAKMASIVFGNEEKRLLLNSIVHPLVFQAQDEWLKGIEKESPDAIAIIDAALMIESGGYKRFDKLIVVVCDADKQLQRLMARNGFSEAEARARIAAQMPQEEKKKYADFVIDTSNGFEDTARQVDGIFDKLSVL